MAIEFTMPKLGLDMTSGTIVRWLVKEGSEILEGQPILEIETDKATQELNAPASGTLARIFKQEGTDVPCNEVMAVITAAGESLQEPGPGGSPISNPVQSVVDIPRSTPVATQASPARVVISPVAKLRARELSLDLGAITPKAGKIGLEEVEEAYRRSQNAPASGGLTAERQTMSITRRKIAEHMSLSARTVARVGLTLEANASALQAWRAKMSQGGRNVSYNVLLAFLTARTLRELPYMNTRLEDDTIITQPDTNIGIAVDTPRGLIVPVLCHVDRKDIVQLQNEYEAMTERALAGRSTLEDLQGGTFTITNLGSLEVETFLPVINLPECAILGVGAILKKPVVVDDQVVIQPRLGLTLAFDHRLVDGVPAGRFLQRLKQLIETAGD
jgi:pyruvate dehydrogenase E2 component (dihydrolipoamide acetyltransferase)